MTTKRNNMGGYSEILYATPEAQELADTCREEIEELMDMKFDMYMAIYYKKQVVSGLNYIIKLKIGESQYIDIKIYKPLPVYNRPPQLIKVMKSSLEEML